MYPLTALTVVTVFEDTTTTARSVKEPLTLSLRWLLVCCMREGLPNRTKRYDLPPAHSNPASSTVLAGKKRRSLTKLSKNCVAPHYSGVLAAWQGPNPENLGMKNPARQAALSGYLSHGRVNHTPLLAGVNRQGYESSFSSWRPLFLAKNAGRWPTVSSVPMRGFRGVRNRR